MNGIKKTQKEIARKLGIFRSYVLRIEKRSCINLSKILKLKDVKNQNTQHTESSSVSHFSYFLPKVLM